MYPGGHAEDLSFSGTTKAAALRSAASVVDSKGVITIVYSDSLLTDSQYETYSSPAK